jgi:glycosyltransferase involved in cell wall biosynthesis
VHVVRILTRPNLGGPMLQALALWHALRERGAGTLLVVGACEPGEAAVDVARAGVPLLEPSAVGPRAEGLLQLPALGNSCPGFRDGRALRELGELLARVRPDVVHTHTSKAGWLGRRAARAAAVPVVAHTFHGLVLRDYFGPVRAFVLRRLERRLAAATDLLFAVSPSCADELAALGVAPRARIRVVPPAVAPGPRADRAAARAALALPADAWAAAWVGRLVPIKRAPHFAEVVRRTAGLIGHLFGDGPQRAALLAAKQSEPRLVVHGAVPHVRELLPAFDALVLTSVREGCPLVTVEAFEAGVPVIGYDVPGVRDALSTWGGGVLVPEAAGPAGLAAALQRVRSDAMLRAECVARGRAARARFQPAAVAQQLLDAYASVRDAQTGYDAERPG